MGRGCGRAAARPGPALPCRLIIALAELAQPRQVCAKPFFICLLQTVLAKAGNSHFDEGESKALGDRRICLNSQPLRTENRFDLRQILKPCPSIQYTVPLLQAREFSESGCQEMPARQEGSHCQDAKLKGI